jgi:hypothetical protein
MSNIRYLLIFLAIVYLIIIVNIAETFLVFDENGVNVLSENDISNKSDDTFNYSQIEIEKDNINLDEWRCLENDNVFKPIRYNNNNIECMSTNNKDCIHSTNKNECENEIEKYKDTLNNSSLSCGEEHKIKFNITGYETTDHWCSIAKDNLNIMPSGEQGISYYIDIETNTLQLENHKALLTNIDRFYRIDNLNVQVIEFNGSNTELYLPKLELNIFSISFLVKLNSSERQVLLSSKDTNWYIDYLNGYLRLVFNEDVLKSKIEVKPNILYHVCLSVSNDLSKLFVNGQEEKMEIFENGTTNEIIFGSNKYNRLPLNGLLGDIKIYRRYLYKDFICNLYKIFCIEPEKKDEVQVQPDIKKCIFIPKGTDRKECVNLCSDYDNCDAEYCQTVCQNCIDYERCKWIPPPIEPKETMPKNISSDLPHPPEIKANAKENDIMLEWVRPYDGGTPITNYLIMVQETLNKANGVRMSLADNENCQTCEKLLTGLKPNTYYSISVRAVNNVGMGKISNIIDIATKGEVIPSKISSSLLESDKQLLDQVKKEIGHDYKKCDNYGHSLDLAPNTSFTDYINLL